MPTAGCAARPHVASERPKPTAHAAVPAVTLSTSSGCGVHAVAWLARVDRVSVPVSPQPIRLSKALTALGTAAVTSKPESPTHPTMDVVGHIIHGQLVAPTSQTRRGLRFCSCRFPGLGPGLTAKHY